jgi:hypothetical protein
LVGKLLVYNLLSFSPQFIEQLLFLVSQTCAFLPLILQLL